MHHSAGMECERGTVKDGGEYEKSWLNLDTYSIYKVKQFC